MKPDFVTLDLETTGLHSNDRIIEVGIVRTSPNGRVVGEYTTLINPYRDVGPTRIHGISAGEVLGAPSFPEIIGDLAEIMNMGIFVAHNASFDRRFFVAELLRAGREHSPFDVLCTLDLVKLAYRGGPRRLGDCCNEFGIPAGEAHQALDDARMASNLLHHLLSIVDVPFESEPIWIAPQPAASAAPLGRGGTRPRDQEATYLATLLSRLDARDDVGVVSAALVAQYFNLLDRVLEDRKLDLEEADVLHQYATEFQFSRERIETLHASYMTSLCAVAMADGVVTKVELADLKTVATLLSVRDWESLLSSEEPNRVTRQMSNLLTPGMTVCFTGDMAMSRADLITMAESAGLSVKGNVSRKLDLLVVADPDSSSGKAKKAREYGVRMVAATVFVEMLSPPT